MGSEEYPYKVKVLSDQCEQINCEHVASSISRSSPLDGLLRFLQYANAHSPSPYVLILFLAKTRVVCLMETRSIFPQVVPSFEKELVSHVPLLRIPCLLIGPASSGMRP